MKLQNSGVLGTRNDLAWSQSWEKSQFLRLLGNVELLQSIIHKALVRSASCGELCIVLEIV